MLFRRLLPLLLLLIVAGPAAAETIRVGIHVNPPLSLIDSQGVARGFVIDLLDLIAAAEGWELEYVPCDWDECNHRLALGDIAMLTPISSNEAKQRRLDYNRESLYVNWGQIVMAGKDVIKSPLDLANKTVVALSSDPHFADLKELAARFDINVRFLEVSDYESVLAWVDQGPVDAGLVPRSFDLAGFRQYPLIKSSVIFNPAEIRVALSPFNGQIPNAKRIQRLDYHLTRLKGDRESPFYQLQERWFGDTATLEIPEWLIWVLLFLMLLMLLLAVGVMLLRSQVRVQTGAIREMNQRFTAFMQHLPGIAYMKSASGQYLFVNPAWERTNHLSEAAVLGRSAADIWPERDLATRLQEERKVLEAGEVVESTEIHPWGDRPSQWQMVRFPITGLSGETEMVGGIGLDVTAQQETARELSHLHHQLALLLESAGDGICGLNGTGRCTFANPAALELLGYSRDELTGSKFHDLVQHTRADETAFPEEESPVYGAYRQGQRAHLLAGVFWHAEGAPFAVEYSAYPIANGELPGAVVIFRPARAG
ncbi:PAS domain-containing protein [Sedimenticola hydrogenitrophicus]|uniref:PAS domain-containing protein n=1 Tax=Sedimenticola hydrogenitrophicus TaxID=2967975 RepID=UPI0021A2EE06|nr:PAS domain-containing protein [Sedimenticola hydrogenitrophicus]